MDNSVFQKVADDHYRLQTTVRNESGLHARVAVAIAQTCMSSDCDVRISTQTREADGRSVLEMLTLAAEQNVSVAVEARGATAEMTLSQVREILSGVEDDALPRKSPSAQWSLAAS